ncbi:MAG: ABC transporter permease [Actinobacteria bacterium]|nr:ABC transporter permease [Actinomycetota bacterium]
MANLHTARYVITAAANALWRNRTMNVGAIITTAIMLITLAAFLAINDTLDQMVVGLGRKSNLIAYVRDEARPSAITELVRDLQRRPGVAEVRYVTKEEALAQFRSQFVEQADLLDLLQSNPLPPSVELRMNDPAALPALAGELRGRGDLFDDVVVPLDVVERLTSISNVSRAVGTAMVIALTGVTLFVIVNTIRIAVYARRQEIEIMKLVGATDWFVRGPFVLEGAAIGAIGALLAAITLVIIYAQAAPTVARIIAFLPISTDLEFVRYLAVFTVLVGLVVGALGSYFSVRRYLSV